MHRESILIAQHDSATAMALARQLDTEFRRVRLARTGEELKAAMLERFDAVIADLETVALNEVSELTRERHLPVICTHRVPDDEMWAAVLDAGALDLCPNDVNAIRSSLDHNVAKGRSVAA